MSYVNLFEVQVTNFPSVFPISGTVIALQGTIPWAVSGSVAVNNFPAVQPVSQSGTWSVGRTWVLNSSTDSVSISNFPSSISVTQGTSPWVVSGTVAATQSGVWNITNITGTISLPTGASTAANQTTANTSLASIDSKLTSPIAVSQSGTWTTGRTWTLSSGTDSISIGNFPATVSVTQGTSPWVVSGTVAATQSGTWNINNISGTISLPTGAATSANQTTANASLASIDGKLNSLGQKTMAGSVPVVIASDQSTVPVSIVGTVPISGTVTANQGTSPWIVSGTVAATQSGTWTTGRTWALSSGTDSVNIGNFPASVSVTQGTSPWIISGTVTANAGTNLNTSALALDTTVAALQVTQGSTTSGEKGTLIMGAVTTAAPSYTTAQTNPLSLTTSGLLRVDGSGATQPISGTVAATQSGTWTTGRTWTLSSGTDSVNIGNFPATVAVTQSGTWNINNISGTISLPTGASTAANQATGNTSLASIDGKLNSLGQKTSAGSVPVVIASDQTISISVSSTSAPQTYSASADFTIAATATDIFTIYGSGTKTIQVKKVRIAFTNTLNTNINVFTRKRSTADTGGTSTTLTATPFDSNNAAATATVKSYTVNPTLGTQVGDGISQNLVFAATLGSTNPASFYENLFGSALDQPVVLRGTGEGLTINLNGATITGVTVAVISVEWVEL